MGRVAAAASWSAGTDGFNDESGRRGQKDREGEYAGGGRQATIAEKRVSLTVEFRISFREITPETAVEMNPSRALEDALGDAARMGEVERQGRLLRALLEDEEALRQFIACAVIEEVAAGGGDLLRRWLNVGATKRR